MRFYGCTSLKDVSLPENLKEIGYQAFANCDSLRSFTIPGSVSKVGSGIFQDCDKIEVLTFEVSDAEIEGGNMLVENCPNFKELRLGRFVELSYHDEHHNWILSFGDSPVDIVILDEANLKYDDYFRYHFSYNKRVPNLTLGRDLKVFPSDLSTLRFLETLTLRDVTPPACPQFKDSQYSTVKLIVPEGSIEAYRQAEGWNRFLTIQETAINNPDAISDKTVISRHDLQGRRVRDDYRGIVIERYSDGSVGKVLKR